MVDDLDDLYDLSIYYENYFGFYNPPKGTLVWWVEK